MTNPRHLQYIALLGCTGSGKSLLSSLLVRLPHSLFADEQLFPPCIAHIINQPLSSQVRAALSTGFEHNLKVFLTSGRTNSRARRVASALSEGKGIRELQAAFRRRMTIASYFYESNFFTLAPEFIFESLPDCLIVHLVRDGRDCAEKLDRQYKPFNDNGLTLSNATMFIGRKFDDRYVPWWVDAGLDQKFISATPYIRCVWFWKAMVGQFRHFLGRLDETNRARVLLVRYEDLVEDPATTLKRVLHFIGRGDAESIVQPRTGKIHNEDVGRSRCRNLDELKVATELASEELSYYGYCSNQ